MRIYQINVVCGNGSTGRIAVDLSRFIQSYEGECRIAYGRGKCALEGIDCIKISSKTDTYIHALLTRITDRHGLYSKKATKKLIDDIKQYVPDIIHLHNLHGYYLNYEMLFAFLKDYNRPVLWTMHDCWAFTGHCAHYDAAGCMKWQEGCHDCPILHNYPATFYGGNVINNYVRKKKSFMSISDLTIVTPSYWLKDQLSKSFLKNVECTTIPNGVDLRKFTPTENNLRELYHCENKILLLGVASVWTKNKGLDDLVKLRSMLDDRYAICLVGLTQKQIRKLPENIIGRERTESMEELAQYYSTADFFLNLTYEDTFSMVNMEALACGTPIIAYATGGSPEIIQEMCGMIVKTGDLNAVAHFLNESVKEKKYYYDACLERASQYDKEECYKQYIYLYKKMLGETI